MSARKKSAAKPAKKATTKATAATRASRTKVAAAPREPGSRQAGTRRAAFLRAINVGGRTVTMDRLRAAFTGLPVDDVETFIASGNVLFTSDALDAAGAAALERAIERRLAPWVVAASVMVVVGAGGQLLARVTRRSERSRRSEARPA